MKKPLQNNKKGFHTWMCSAFVAISSHKTIREAVSIENWTDFLHGEKNLCTQNHENTESNSLLCNFEMEGTGMLFKQKLTF